MNDDGEQPPALTRRTASGRVVWVLIVLATIVGIAATLGSWVDRQALDTDEWVSVSDDMLADDDIRAALSQFLVTELFRTVDVAGGIEALLPGRTAQLAGPIAATLQANAVSLTDQSLGTEQFRSVWSTVNRTAHTAFVRVANGADSTLLSTSGGAFVVDLRELIVQVADRLGLPGTLVDRIPADAGRIVVFESNQIDALQQAVRVVNLLSLYLFVLVAALYAAAVFLAVDRRVVLRHVGVFMVVGSVVLLVAQRLLIEISVDQLARAENRRAAVGALATIATSLLNELAWAWLALGVVIAVYAVLVGTSRLAVAARGVLALVMIYRVAAWSLALGALGLYATLAPGVSIDRWVVAVVLAAVFVSGVELLRRQIVREHRLAGRKP